MRSSTIVSFAGNAPARRRIARLLACSTVKRPEIWPEPPVIGPRMRGAEITFPSRTMANSLPTFSDVTSPNFWPPRILKRKLTIGSCVRAVEARLRIGQVLALNHDALLDGNLAGFFDLIQKFDLGRICARLGDEAEFELRRLAENFLELFRVLQARHLDENAVVALALDIRLLVPSASTRRRSTSIDCSTARRTFSVTPASVTVT